ncbi:MAG TPA: imidazole glycerol phosphate synthase subunit HisH [Candidatus Fimenecus excrementavium]|nr:imidazole glycerol phosphate synthase subunit HisH [Candidatus Fimenecus excrementavium]
MIAIIDYGAGNLQSVKKALDYLGEPNLITAKSSEIEAADALVLPGVGSFGDAMQSLTDSGLLETVRAAALSDTPFLGICLGLQLLFPESEESKGVKGLGVLPGKIIKFPGDMGIKIPQIGWNSINIREGCKLYAGVPQNAYVYFVHSYYLQAADPEVVAAKAEYGVTFHASVADEAHRLYATQFHPEKSGAVGLRILRNFAAMQKGRG